MNSPRRPNDENNAEKTYPVPPTEREKKTPPVDDDQETPEADEKPAMIDPRPMPDPGKIVL